MKLCNHTLKTYKLLINSPNETSHVPIYSLLYLQNPVNLENQHLLNQWRPYQQSHVTFF